MEEGGDEKTEAQKEEMSWGGGELSGAWDAWSVEPRRKEERKEEGKREVNALTNREPTWRKDEGDKWSIVGTMDTGAFTTIFTKDMVPGMKVEKTANSGKSCTVASGDELSIEGEAKFSCIAKNNTTLKMNGLVADVVRPLFAGIDIVDAPGADNWIVLHKKGGYVWDGWTKKVVPIDRTGRKWEIEVKVPKEVQEVGKSSAFMPYGKTFKKKVAFAGDGGHCGQTMCTHNRYTGLEEDNWNLGFVGQDKH